MPNKWKAVNVGPHAARILVESVQDLRQLLRQRGSELVVRWGCTVPLLLDLIEKSQATEMVWNEAPGLYEMELSERVKAVVKERFPALQIRTSMDCTLYHPDDLPRGSKEWGSLAHPKMKMKLQKKCKVVDWTGLNKDCRGDDRITDHPDCVNVSAERWDGMPPIMGDFRKAARQKTNPRPCLENTVQLRDLPAHIEPGEIPTLASLLEPIMSLSDCPESPNIMGLSTDIVREVCRYSIRIHCSNQASNTPIYQKGGESCGLSHLKNFCRNHAAVAQRNTACVDNHQSSRVSHYLAFGCLSPRRIVEEARQQGDACNWILSHMTMRDFFLYTCLAAKDRFYRQEGIPVNKKGAESIVWKSLDEPETVHAWERWATGSTGLPLVDAAMQELLQTGYCSNRVRQNAASVLTKDLSIDWRAGAEWFQFLLSDHCVGANWGNWLYFSGKGNDPKHRHFRTVSQALKYDQDGVYVKKWLPELRTVAETSDNQELFLRPWDFFEKTQWQQPIVSPDTQYTWNDKERLAQTGTLLSFPGSSNP